MYKGLCKLNDIIYNVLKILIIILLISMSIMVFAQVIFRYLINRPLAWSEELSTYAFSWLSFIGAAVVLKNKNHVAVSSVVDGIKNSNFKKVVILISQILILSFLIVVIYHSIGLITILLQNDQRLLNVESIKLGYLFMQVPLSSIAMFLIMVQHIIENLKSDHKVHTEIMEGEVK